MTCPVPNLQSIDVGISLYMGPRIQASYKKERHRP